MKTSTDRGFLANRREFVLAAVGFAFARAIPRADSQPVPVLLFSAAELKRVKKALRAPGGLETHAKQMRANAEKALSDGPWSVTYQRPKSVDASPNDYYSEASYWWPDPQNPDGPYILRDGEKNPHRFLANYNAMVAMSDAVLALGQAAFFLDDAGCAQRAATVLDVWFLDAKTRMNPNLEYGQGVPRRSTGRATGIIDTTALTHCVLGISLAEASGRLDRSLAAGVRRWYADFLKWLTTSSKGLEEKEASNNHSTWWTAQVAAYASFTNDVANQKMAWNHYRHRLLPSQVQPDGGCPNEERRTRSLSYSAMNLDGFSVLCRLGEMNGEDLWRYRTPAGIGIEKAFSYLMPFVLEPNSWRKQQITGFDQDRIVYLGLAGLALRVPEMLSAYRKLPRSPSPWVQLVDLLVRSAASGSENPA